MYMSGGGEGNSSEPARGIEVRELTEPGGVYSFGAWFPIESCEDTEPKIKIDEKSIGTT